jgi:hypothetical protein
MEWLLDTASTYRNQASRLDVGIKKEFPAIRVPLITTTILLHRARFCLTVASREFWGRCVTG